MTSETQGHQALGRLSAVMDGEAEESALSAVCLAWRDEEESRANWHAWHLIGDVMRSEDLASTATGDAAFLAAFRARLADEPVILAPPVAADVEARPAFHAAEQMLVANAGRVRRRRTWSASAAVAAGFVVVAGAVLVVQRTGTSPAPIAVEAKVDAKAPQGNVVPVSTPIQSPPARAEPVLVVSDKMIRDARLQQYLAAHKQFGGATALGVPSGFLRSATVESPSR